MTGRWLLLTILGACLLSGCMTVPANKLPVADADGRLMKEVMAKKDRIVHLSSGPDIDISPGFHRSLPALLLLHGATEDPTEMMAIAQQWEGQYDIFLYSYNFHRHVKKVAVDLAKEVARLKASHVLGPDVTVIVYSYSAIIFREAVILADARTFSGASLIQLVPTAGGSHLARYEGPPGVSSLVALVSRPSAAEKPYGHFAEQLWAGAGNRKFYKVIQPTRVHTLLLEGDTHSLAGINDLGVQTRYRNGLGPNVIVIPKTVGLTHDYFPTHPIALAYLKKTMELARQEANPVAAQAVDPNSLTIGGRVRAVAPSHPAH